jgi:hypothetical protein
VPQGYMAPRGTGLATDDTAALRLGTSSARRDEGCWSGVSESGVGVRLHPSPDVLLFPNELWERSQEAADVACFATAESPLTVLFAAWHE